ncbi:MAG: hypothetical protein ACRDJI_04875, partial [Actinomycetota bacterium]
MFRESVVVGSTRRVVGVLAAAALAMPGLFVADRSDAAPAPPTFLQQATDQWSGEWLAEGQNQEGGTFHTFGVITFELLGPAEFDVDAVCEQGDLLYEGSYEYGGGGTVSGCSYEPDVLAGDYFNNGGNVNCGPPDCSWGQFLIEMEGGSWEGVYSPPTTNPAGVPATLEWRGKRPDTQSCEEPPARKPGTARARGGASGSGDLTMRKARLAETSTELARPFPIEGSWYLCPTGVRVTPGTQDGTFVGTTVGRGGFSGCDTDYGADVKVWEMTIESSTPSSTVYRGTYLCDGGQRPATWEVFPDDKVSSDTVKLCPTETGSGSCSELVRTERASRRFRVTLNGNPNEPMNAVDVDKDGNITPRNLLYLTTTAELKNVTFGALWNVSGDRFHDFSAPTGTLIIEDLYFPPHRDELTKLKITGFKDPDEYLLDPGRDAASDPPDT